LAGEKEFDNMDETLLDPSLTTMTTPLKSLDFNFNQIGLLTMRTKKRRTPEKSTIERTKDDKTYPGALFGPRNELNTTFTKSFISCSLSL
jgi:hypothetical protein